MINQNLLDQCVKNNKNVLFYGRHGVGKTALVNHTFKKHKLNYIYFSAATMDPWIDFIGVPREINDGENLPYLDLVRPKHFRNDEVEAIFLDEYNRSAKAVRNAVMELIQFKSINGFEFKNLRMVWAAVNPDDGNYDTESLCPAQKDRFHYHIKISYDINEEYFAKKYGGDKTEALSNWWHNLSPEIQNEVSPRRLDYAMESIQLGMDITGFVLPEKSGVSKLLQDLEKGPVIKDFEHFLEKEDEEEMKKFLSNENNFAECEKLISKKAKTLAFCMELLTQEKQITILSKYKKARDYVFTHPGNFKSLIEIVAETSQNKGLKERAIKVLLKGSSTKTVDVSTKTNSVVLQQVFAQKHKQDINIFEQSDYPAFNTYVRRQSLRELQKYVKNKALKKEHALSVLKILETIVVKSHTATLLSNLVKNDITIILNECVTSLIKAYQMSDEDIKTLIPATMKKIVSRLIKQKEEFIFNG